MKDQYEGAQSSSKDVQAYRNTVGSASVKADTLPSLLEDVEKLAAQIRMMTERAANTLNGLELRPGETEKPERQDSIINKVQEIRSILRGAIENEQRVMNALAL